MPSLDDSALDQAFRTARTFNKFKPDAVSDETLAAVHALMKWGPTSMNCQPARFAFLRSEAAKQRLKPALMPGNADKTMVAPVVVIVAWDPRFFDELPTQWTASDAKPMFEGNAALADATARRNGTLQGGYFIVAARMLGLDCGPMSGFDTAKVDAEFFAADGPMKGWKSNFLINLGYGDASGNYPRGPRLAFEKATQTL